MTVFLSVSGMKSRPLGEGLTRITDNTVIAARAKSQLRAIETSYIA